MSDPLAGGADPATFGGGGHRGAGISVADLLHRLVVPPEAQVAAPVIQEHEAVEEQS